MKTLALLVAMSLAQHSHPPQDAPIHEQFYKNWQRPDNPAVSCCSNHDCYPVEAQFKDGHWFVKQRENGKWLWVDPKKIEHGRDNPDGRNHACISPMGHVFCFIIGGGG